MKYIHSQERGYAASVCWTDRESPPGTGKSAAANRGKREDHCAIAPGRRLEPGSSPLSRSAPDAWHRGSGFPDRCLTMEGLPRSAALLIFSKLRGRGPYLPRHSGLMPVLATKSLTVGMSVATRAASIWCLKWAPTCHVSVGSVPVAGAMPPGLYCHTAGAQQGDEFYLSGVGLPQHGMRL